MSRIKRTLVFLLFCILVVEVFYIKSCIIKTYNIEEANVKYYYYNQLSTEEKKIYDTLASSKEDIMDNKDMICLGEINIDNEDIDKITENIFSRVIWAYCLDNPMSTLWFSTYKKYLSYDESDESSSTIVKFYINPKEGSYYSFDSKEDLLEAINIVETKTQEFVNTLSGTDEEKLQSIHDWLIQDTKYNEVDNPHMNDLYGCIVQKETVCGGLAYSMKYVSDMANIPVLSVFGRSVYYDEYKRVYVEYHAWNVIYVDNNWYLSDLTRDRRLNEKYGTLYRYKCFKLPIDSEEYYEEKFDLPK